MARLLAAPAKCGFDGATAYRVKSFILLQRWSGLACMDAATLRRDGLKDDNNLILGRNKTGTEVFVPPPTTVADMLRSLPNDHSAYFYRNPDRMGKTSIVALFGDLLRTEQRQNPRRGPQNGCQSQTADWRAPGEHRGTEEGATLFFKAPLLPAPACSDIRGNLLPFAIDVTPPLVTMRPCLT